MGPSWPRASLTAPLPPPPHSVPTFTVVPEAPRSPSPLMVVDEEMPTEGVPIEQYRAWLGKPRDGAPGGSEAGVWL